MVIFKALPRTPPGPGVSASHAADNIAHVACMLGLGPGIARWLDCFFSKSRTGQNDRGEWSLGKEVDFRNGSFWYNLLKPWSCREFRFIDVFSGAQGVSAIAKKK